MEIERSKILVTGGGGFVGAPTVRALIAAGAQVRVLDAVRSPRLEGLDCEIVIGDITDAELVGSCCAGVDGVLHLAVLPLTAANTEHEAAFQTNVRGSFNVFRAAGDNAVKRVVYSSASSAYGGRVWIQLRHPALYERVRTRAAGGRRAGRFAALVGGRATPAQRRRDPGL
jgi:nucleoside-diphosphate-sugar epimerase